MGQNSICVYYFPCFCLTCRSCICLLCGCAISGRQSHHCQLHHQPDPWGKYIHFQNYKKANMFTSKIIRRPIYSLFPFITRQSYLRPIRTMATFDLTTFSLIWLNCQIICDKYFVTTCFQCNFNWDVFALCQKLQPTFGLYLSCKYP